MQNDYISRQEAIYNFKTRKDFLRQWVEKESQRRIGINIAIDVVKAMPAADVVKVVRCKECKHWKPTMPSKGIVGICEDMNHFGRFWKPDDFCSYGERKE